MKIKKLDIYGYGKWVDQHFELEDQLQLFYGQNEAGKSTLQSFIRSILFGFPDKRYRVNQINRYEPKMADVYGGRILLTETKLGTVWVERTLDGLKVTDQEGTDLAEDSLDIVLGGLDENLFDAFYAFSLQNLQELANVDSDKLSDYFLSIGTLGSDKFLSVAKEFEKESDALFKPKGQKPALNQALKDYESLAKALDTLKGKMDQYDQLVQQSKECQLKIDETNEAITQVEQSLSQIDKLMGRYDIYVKDQQAANRLDQLVYTEMDPQLPEQLAHSLKIQSEGQALITQMEERIRNINHEMTALTRLNWAKNHQEERRQWARETAHIKEVQGRLEHVQERIQEQTNQLARLAQEGQFYPEKLLQVQNYSAEIENGIELKAQLDQARGQQETLQAQRKVFIDQRRELQTYSGTVRHQYAQLENQRLNEKAQLSETTSWKHYGLSMTLFVFSAILFVFNRFRFDSQVVKWPAIVLMGLAVASGIYIFIRHQQAKNNYQNSPIIEKMQELRQKDQQYQERSNALGGDINDREAALREGQAQIQALESRLQNWLVQLGFYPTAEVDLVLKSNPAKEYRQVLMMRDQYEQELSDLQVEILDWRHHIQELLQRFPFEEQPTRPLIQHVEEVEASLARQMERGKAMEERRQNAEEVIELQSKKIKEEQQQIEAIYQATNAFDEVDFQQKLRVNQEVDQLKAKRQLYADQMVGYEEELEAITSKQRLIESYNQEQNQLNQLKAQLQPYLYQRADLAVSMNQLEQDGSYQTLIQELADKKSEIIQLYQQWAKKRIAMDLIYRTLRQGFDNPLPEMNQLANEIFSLLTYNRYTQINLNKKGIKVRQFSDILFEPHELSQGTLEQLYVALRLAFIATASRMVKMPIMIDDAFVNFDEVRKTSMYKVLQKVSQNHQVLFFTFDQQAQEMLANDHQIDLNQYVETVEASKSKKE